MIKYFILIMLIMGSLAGGSQVLISNLLKTSISIENRSLVRSAINVLKQRAVAVNGQYYLPYGVNEDGRHVLPTSFVGVRSDANGKSLVYCPYAQSLNGTPTHTVDTSASSSYAVTVSTTVVPGGVSYVVNSDAPPVSGIAALLIVPKREAAIPNCADVAVDASGNLALSGGSEGEGTVYAITVDELMALHQDAVFYDIRTSADLLPALQDAAGRSNMDAVFTLAGGVNYTLAQTITLSSSNPELKRKLIFKNSGAQRATINPSAGVEIRINDANLFMSGVDFGVNGVVRLNRATGTVEVSSLPVLHATDSQLTTNSVTWGRAGQTSVPLTLAGSIIKQRGADVIRGAAPLLVSMQDSEWNASANLSMIYTGSPTGFQLRNSELIVNNATVSSSGAGNVLLYSDTSSKVRLNTVTWTNSGALSYGVYSMGKLDMYNTLFRGNSQVNTAVYTHAGSLSHVEGSVIGNSGSRPVFGWRDAGAAGLSGTAQVYASTCKDGGRFNVTDSAYTITASDRFATKASTSTGLVIQYVTNPQAIPVDVDAFFAPLALSCL